MYLSCLCISCLFIRYCYGCFDSPPFCLGTLAKYIYNKHLRGWFTGHWTRGATERYGSSRFYWPGLAVAVAAVFPIWANSSKIRIFRNIYSNVAASGMRTTFPRVLRTRSSSAVGHPFQIDTGENASSPCLCYVYN